MKKRGVYIDPLWAAFLLAGVALGLLITAARPANAVEAVEPVVKVVEVPVRVEVPVVKTVVETVEELPTEVEDSPLESIGSFKVTAYCACEKCCGKTPDDPWYGITATGTKATEGRTIAVDPKVIPYGTVVYFEGIDGFGGYVAEDCGGAIKGNDIDLYFDSHAEALNWGVREQEVFLYKE